MSIGKGRPTGTNAPARVQGLSVAAAPESGTYIVGISPERQHVIRRLASINGLSLAGYLLELLQAELLRRDEILYRHDGAKRAAEAAAATAMPAVAMPTAPERQRLPQGVLTERVMTVATALPERFRAYEVCDRLGDIRKSVPGTLHRLTKLGRLRIVQPGTRGYHAGHVYEVVREKHEAAA